MNSDEIRSFGEVFNGKTPSKTEHRSQGLPILKIRDIDENGQFHGHFESFVDPIFYEKYSRKRLRATDTIILNAAHNSSYVGTKSAFVSSELQGVIATGEWLIVRVNEADPAYVNHFLRSPLGRKRLKSCVKGIHLYPKDVERIEVPLPQIEDQKRIAYLLGKVEGLIAQRKQHLQQLDDLLKSVFLEMFGDPVRNTKGWETVRFEELCEDVIDCPHSTPDYTNQTTGYYCVRSSDIVDGYLDLSETLHVEQAVFEERIKRYTPKIGDILYSREGGRLGNAARILGNQAICLGQRIMLFEVGEESRANFLWALLESRSFKAKVRSLVGGGAAPRINIKDLKKIPVIRPTHNIQLLFSQITNQIDRVKLKYQQSLADLETLYGALSQKAFKGELDLSRVPLPTESSEKLNEEKPEVEVKPIMEQSIHLPAPTDLDALKTLEGRKAQLNEWLTLWLQQREDKEFVANDFMQAAQRRLWEFVEDETPDLGVAEYDQIKAKVFAAVEDGRMQQIYNDAKNEVQITAD